MSEAIEFNCPFCGKQSAAGMEIADGRPGVVHSLPMCQNFRRLSPQAYMRAVNESLAKDTKKIVRKTRTGMVAYAAGGAAAGFVVAGPLGAAFGALLGAAAGRT